MTLPSETFCVLPWMHFYVDEEGTHSPCCVALREEAETGSPPVESDLEGAWNSFTMREIRLQMLAGQAPPACQACYGPEAFGMQSLRRHSNRTFERFVPSAGAGTAADGSVRPTAIRSVDLRLGNLCNLRCRMCGPRFSSPLIDEWARLTDHDLDRYRDLDWFERPAFRDLLEALAPNLERLHFAGGEPLRIPIMFRFLERLVELDLAGGIELSYNTNLTLLPERALELWPRFRSVLLVVSLDGVGDVNSLIRHPSRWATLESNLFRIDRDAETLGVHPVVNTTVQALNVHRLGDLVTYLEGGFERFGAPNLTLLTQPRHFGIRILPPALKDAAAARLEGAIEALAGARWSPPTTDALRAALRGVIDHMMAADETDALPEFRRWTAVQDASRGMRTADVLPELAPILGG